MKYSTVKAHVAREVLLFDGGMGTYYSARTKQDGAGCEYANITAPELILDIHREYLAAGAQAIKTNTFAANLDTCQESEELLQQVITAGWQLACQAAGDQAHVFADIGPIQGKSDEETGKEYRLLADIFLRLGAENFLFETNSGDVALAQTADYIKARNPAAFVLISFAAQPDGYTREGFYAVELLRRMTACHSVDAVGLNCICGARHMLELAQTLPTLEKPLSLMPNAGYPIVIQNRTFYEGDPVYFASQTAEMAASGAKILGGCCGTTPVHIAAMARALTTHTMTQREKTSPVQPPQRATMTVNRLQEKLLAGKRVIAVELDPPKVADSESFMDGARRLQAAGIDTLTIADCPIARARMDSSLLACKVKRELDLDVIPHMTCRDRNLNATKALLLGLFAEGVGNVLTVTGDPIPTAERDEVKSVYQFNSRKMARFISNLGQNELPASFLILGALNVNARNFDEQLRIAREKLSNGMSGFLTQPVLTCQAFENLKRAREALPCWILGGIMPVVSAKNARFMNSEINGIHVSPEVIALYEGKNREEGEALALTVSAEIARRISPYVDGYYLMTPFHRVELMERLVKTIREELEQ